MSSEESSGFKVFADSLSKPFLTICGNSGHQNAQFALGVVQNANREEHFTHQESETYKIPATAWTKCVDLGSGELIDVMEKGIVDSAAAIIETLKNGASAGSQLLSLSGVVNTPVKPVPMQQAM